FSGDINPTNGDILINDVGNDKWEEVDRLVKGANYGWPTAEGNSTNPAFTNPLFEYPHNGNGAAITSGAVYISKPFPASYSGQYFFADLVQDNIRLLNPATGQATVWATNLSFPTDLKLGPDGNIYWSQISPFGAIYKISYVGVANRPPTAATSA